MDRRTPSLVKNFLAGDAASYEVLFRRYHESLRRYLMNRSDAALRREVSVAELIQETHAEALGSLHRFQYRQELAFFYWLCAIARHCIARHCRRLRRAPPVVLGTTGEDKAHLPSGELVAALADSKPTALDELVKKEALHVLAVGLDKLHHRRRKAIVLTSFEGLSGEEAAASMGIAPGAFRVLRARALAELAAGFVEMFGEG